MAREDTLKMSGEDAAIHSPRGDFSGGLNSQKDPLELAANEAQDCQNVKLDQDGRCIGRDGSTDLIPLLPGKPDGGGYFLDVNEVNHDIGFCNGNLYELTTGVAVLIAAGVYTAGRAVTFTALNGIVYYSDGATIFGGNSGTRQWDPVAAVEQTLVSSGSTGTIPTPAANVLAVYAGSLIWADVTYVSGATARSAFLFSNVNDPTTLIGTNIQSVGTGTGGHINTLANLAVAAPGVSPFKSLYVGKSRFGVYLYTGPLGQMLEALVNVATGVRDGASFQYVPGPDGHAYGLFFGCDFKFWVVDGVNAFEISKNIRKEVFNAATKIIATTPAQRFRACLNEREFQYICDFGGSTQYVFHYQVKAWTRYLGWRSGWLWQSQDANGLPRLRVAADDGQYTALSEGATDNGAPINPYWLGAFDTGGDDELEKFYKHIYVNYATDNGDLQIDARTNLGNGPQISKNIPAPTAGAGAAGIWDGSTWDGALWGGPSSSAFPYYKARRRLNRQAPLALDPQQSFDDLKGYDIQIKLSSTVPGGHFEILSYTVTYIPKGRQRVANL